jgi:hypothetical protein
MQRRPALCVHSRDVRFVCDQLLSLSQALKRGPLFCFTRRLIQNLDEWRIMRDIELYGRRLERLLRFFFVPGIGIRGRRLARLLAERQARHSNNERQTKETRHFRYTSKTRLPKF